MLHWRRWREHDRWLSARYLDWVRSGRSKPWSLLEVHLLVVACTIAQTWLLTHWLNKERIALRSHKVLWRLELLVDIHGCRAVVELRIILCWGRGSLPLNRVFHIRFWLLRSFLLGIAGRTSWLAVFERGRVVYDKRVHLHVHALTRIVELLNLLVMGLLGLG